MKDNNLDNKLILYELNEVPKRIIDLYIGLYPKSNFAKILSKGIFLETITKDDGELHPWSTWPTVHRGVNNFLHNIRYINQDLTKTFNYKPIWEILVDNEINVGIFGSLQSFPPLYNDKVCFYLPDTFAPSPKAFPSDLMEFQKFNLDVVGENKAISRKITFNQINSFLRLINKNIISKQSAFNAVNHILKEKINHKYKTRRSLLQPELSFDLFFNNLNFYSPNFSTYFTNHVAGMMHRYWKDLFPQDFKLEKTTIDSFYSQSILKAMSIADVQIGRLINLSEKENYDIWIISSMGQSSINRGDYIPELVIRDISKLIKILKLDVNAYTLLPAMQPDICIDCLDGFHLTKLRKSIKQLKDSNGNLILEERYEPVGLRLNLSIQRSKAVIKDQELIFEIKKYDLKETGFQIIKRNIGTGYHIPKGIFIAYGNKSIKIFKKKSQLIDTCKICPTILKFFGFNKLDYMMDPL